MTFLAEVLVCGGRGDRVAERRAKTLLPALRALQLDPVMLEGEERKVDRKTLRRRLATLLEESHPAALLVMDPSAPVAGEAMRKARRAGIPILVDLVSTLGRPRSALKNKAQAMTEKVRLRAAGALLVDTEEEVVFMADRTGLPQRMFSVVPPTDPYAPREASFLRVPGPNDPIELLCQLPCPGLDDLLDAMESHPGVRLTVIDGSKNERSVLRRNLPNVEVGTQDFNRLEIQEQIDRSHLVVCTLGRSARTDRSIPFGVARCLGSGRPVLVQGSPPLDRIIGHGVGGFLLETVNAQEICRLLALISKRPEELSGMAVSARSAFDAHLGPGAVLRGLARAFKCAGLGWVRIPSDVASASRV